MRVLSRVAAAAAFLASFLPLPALAVPITRTVTGTSSISTGLSLAGTATLVTSLGNVSRSFPVGGTLSDKPTGMISVDWGSPGWNDALTISGPIGVDLLAANRAP